MQESYESGHDERFFGLAGLEGGAIRKVWIGISFEADGEGGGLDIGLVVLELEGLKHCHRLLDGGHGGPRSTGGGRGDVLARARWAG